MITDKVSDMKTTPVFTFDENETQLRVKLWLKAVFFAVDTGQLSNDFKRLPYFEICAFLHLVCFTYSFSPYSYETGHRYEHCQSDLVHELPLLWDWRIIWRILKVPPVKSSNTLPMLQPSVLFLLKFMYAFKENNKNNLNVCKHTYQVGVQWFI